MNSNPRFDLKLWPIQSRKCPGSKGFRQNGNSWFMIRRLLPWLLLLPLVGYADEAVLADLLVRIRHIGPVELRYEETRKLELAASPVLAEGRMYSGADGSLVKLQLSPRRIVMAIAEGRMLYFDPEEGRHDSVPLDQAGPAAAQITVFRSLLQGHAEELRPAYEFEPEVRGRHWSLRLTPKPGGNGEEVPSIEISGDEEGRRQRVLIRQPDGETTEYRLEQAGEGQNVEDIIQSLLREAAGE